MVTIKKYKEMKKILNKSIPTPITFALIFVCCPQLFAAPPPPPGVPIDAGISVLIVAAVGYGATKMSKNKNEI